MTVPVELGIKNTESFSPQPLQGFWSKLKKHPEIVVMSKKEVTWQQYRLSLAVAEYQICGGRHFPHFGTKFRKDLMSEKGKIPSENIIVVGLSCVEERPSGSSIIWVIFYSHLNSFQNHASMSCQPNGKSEQFLETVSPRQKLVHSRRHSIGNMR